MEKEFEIGVRYIPENETREYLLFHITKDHKFKLIGSRRLIEEFDEIKIKDADEIRGEGAELKVFWGDFHCGVVETKKWKTLVCARNGKELSKELGYIAGREMERLEEDIL